jgi:hypothetical protein
MAPASHASNIFFSYTQPGRGEFPNNLNSASLEPFRVDTIYFILVKDSSLLGAFMVTLLLFLILSTSVSAIFIKYQTFILDLILTKLN